MQINPNSVLSSQKPAENPQRPSEASSDARFATFLSSNLKGVLKELQGDLIESVGGRFEGDVVDGNQSRPEGAIEASAFAPQGQRNSALPTGFEPKSIASSQNEVPLSKGPDSVSKPSSPDSSSSSTSTENENKEEEAESVNHGQPKREEVASTSQKQQRELGALIQAATEKSAADPGSFASLATARFAAMRQDQRQIVEALKSSEKGYTLQGVSRPEVAASTLAPAGSVHTAGKNGLSLTQEVFGKTQSAYLQNDETQKNFEVFFDRKANSANISVNHERHGQIKMKVDVNGSEVQLVLLSKDTEVQQLIGSNIQSLKDQLAQKGLTLSFGFEGQPNQGNSSDRDGAGTTKEQVTDAIGGTDRADLTVDDGIISKA